MRKEDWFRNKYYIARASTNRSQVYINRLDEAKQRAGGTILDYLKGAPAGNGLPEEGEDMSTKDQDMDLPV